MIPTSLSPEATPERVCAIAQQWKIDAELALRLHLLAWELQLPVSIISGARTPEEQEALRRAGRPTAPDNLSTHLSCPATGADLRVHVPLTESVKSAFGMAARRAGLRWGGGSPRNAHGIPSDWNHVDLGPRL